MVTGEQTDERCWYPATDCCQADAIRADERARVIEEYQNRVKRLIEVLQDVTDVAHQRQRTEWRHDEEQLAIDAAYEALAAERDEGSE